MRKILTILMAFVLVVVAAANAQPASAQDGVITPNVVPPPPTNPLQVIKVVKPYYDVNWTWTINKSANKTTLLLSEGEIVSVTYTVTVTAEKHTSGYGMEGFVKVYNMSSTDPMTVTKVTDTLLPDNVNVPFYSCSLPANIPVGPDTYIKCYFDYSLPDGTTRTNVGYAEATVAGVQYSDDDSVPVNFADAVALHEADECVTVTDTNVGTLGTVCATDANKTFTFTYSLDFGTDPTADVVLECGENTHRNVASFVTNDTGTTGSDDATVTATVACGNGCTLTPGYWKTHSDRGPAPYDAAWTLVGPLEEDTPFYLSGQTWYQVFWTSPNGNSYYILAHAYMAAKLNTLDGASAPAEVTAALTAAEALFIQYTPEQVTKIVKPEFITLATLLDNYNNGLIGPGHCTE